MRWTKKRIVLTLLEALFILIAPLVFIFVQYSSIEPTPATTQFKISFGGVVLLIVVFILVKRLWIDRFLQDLRHQINNWRSDIKITTRQDEIANLEREIKKARTIESVLGAVMPILIFLAAIVLCRGLETQLVKFSGALSFIALSYGIGTVFSVLNAREVKGKHRREEE